MKERFSYYFEHNNALFDGDVLAICYKATESEVKNFKLTNPNVLIFIKALVTEGWNTKKNIDYLYEIKKFFKGQKIFFRIQSECMLGIYGDSHCDCEEQRRQAIHIISKNGGIYIHLPQEAQGWGLFYKLNELELQVSGRDLYGNYIGEKNRDDAQKILTGDHQFNDLRSYEIIYMLLDELGLSEEKFILISDSEKKFNALKNLKIDVERYKDFIESDINSDNLSEYLVKLLNSTHDFSDNTIDKIIKSISERNYNERTLVTLTAIVDKINNDPLYVINDSTKHKLLDVYDKIICGEEKRYIFNGNIIKMQNNFSCKVNSSIFIAIKKIYGNCVFDRISLEKLYYFESKSGNTSIRIRSSKILDTINDKSIFMKGQIHVEQRLFNEDNNQILQN